MERVWALVRNLYLSTGSSTSSRLEMFASYFYFLYVSSELGMDMEGKSTVPSLGLPWDLQRDASRRRR